MNGRILVTGGAGFIGSHLVDRLVAAGQDVIVLDNFSSGSRKNIAQHEGQIEIIEANVLDIRDHAHLLKGVGTIYHLAALISSHDSLVEPETYWNANINGLLRLIDVLHAKTRIVFSSSSTVYGDQGDVGPLSETTIPDPLTAYAATKLAGEHTLSMFGAFHGFSHVCLRLFNVYGPRQSPDHPYANVTCKFAEAAANGRGISLFGDGEQSRDFVFVDDVVDAFMAVGEKASQAVYNVGTGSGTSILKLISTLSELSEKPLEVDKQPAWSNDIRAIRADSSRLQDEFGLSAKTSIEDGLRRTVEWFKE